MDGDTLVVGVPHEDSSTAGVQNSATPTVDEAVLDAGAVYVFVRTGTTWSQQAYLKASQVSAEDGFGTHVAIHGDTIVVGAPHEDSSTTGVQNSATPTVDEAALDAGAVYVFVRTETIWQQQAYLKASQVSPADMVGTSVAITGDTIVVGATGEASSTAGVQNSATPTVDETTPEAGAALVFTRNGTTWSQQAYLKASQVSAGDIFGKYVAIADDTIVVGAPQEDSSTVGIQHSATPTVDEAALDAGAAYVFVRSGTMWNQQAYLKASQVSAGDIFGWSVAVDGETIVVGVPHDDSSTTGIQNSATPTVDEASIDAGAASVFMRSGTTWSQQAYFKASQVSAGDIVGFSVAVDGDTIVVGAPHEDSSRAGVQNSAVPTVDEAMLDAGAAYRFSRSGTTWSQQAYLKAVQVSASDIVGFSVAVDGETIVIGAPYEDSSTTGVQHSTMPTVDEAALDAGAVYGLSTGHVQYLPFVATSQPLLLATLTPVAVPTMPVTTPRMIFFTATITLPNELPAYGHYWLSAHPRMLVPSLVDDAVMLRAGTTTIFAYTYSLQGQPLAAFVELPADVLLPWAGHAITIELTDVSGSVYSSTPLYLLWTP
ncbi:FG-GAP repeat protein [Herpetosiphon gulosus]|uniref:FG-GAP repeat protein n=1 Tax=Herpetosiphon gulosus TaxID=1973496 RepID=UPI0031E73EF7